MKEIKLITSLEEMDSEDMKELDRVLTEDILERYNHSEYHEPEVITAFLEEHNYELAEERYCVKCGKTSGLLDNEDICYTCAKERDRI